MDSFKYFYFCLACLINPSCHRNISFYCLIMRPNEWQWLRGVRNSAEIWWSQNFSMCSLLFFLLFCSCITSACLYSLVTWKWKSILIFRFLLFFIWESVPRQYSIHCIASLLLHVLLSGTDTISYSIWKYLWKSLWVTWYPLPVLSFENYEQFLQFLLTPYKIF